MPTATLMCQMTFSGTKFERLKKKLYLRPILLLSLIADKQ